jgi:hypothetical protein
MASNRPIQLAAVTVDDLDNFYLIGHDLEAYPYKLGNFPLVSFSMVNFPKIPHLHGKFSKNFLVSL